MLTTQSLASFIAQQQWLSGTYRSCALGCLALGAVLFAVQARCDAVLLPATGGRPDEHKFHRLCDVCDCFSDSGRCPQGSARSAGRGVWSCLCLCCKGLATCRPGL